MKVLVTGAAGFIGYYTAVKFCEMGYDVVGIDNLNDYYDVNLKLARLDNLKSFSNFKFQKVDISNSIDVEEIFRNGRFDRVVHLAAQAGVRYSIENPKSYVDSNLVGFVNILEACRYNDIEHLVYASSSSVYGMNAKVPYSTRDAVDHPCSLYAATKKSNELLAHSYSHLYGLPTTGLRFFTVIGPWGRPDMALWLFTKAILSGKTINVFNNGELKRDFTDIKDIVEGVVRIQDVIPEGVPSFNNSDPSKSSSPYRIFNIGNNNPVELGIFISEIENQCGVTANKEYFPMQLGDVYQTFADTDDLFQTIRFKPKTSLTESIRDFVQWFKSWNQI